MWIIRRNRTGMSDFLLLIPAWVYVKFCLLFTHRNDRAKRTVVHIPSERV
jgi:hypothetical protein